MTCGQSVGLVGQVTVLLLAVRCRCHLHEAPPLPSQCTMHRDGDPRLFLQPRDTDSASGKPSLGSSPSLSQHHSALLSPILTPYTTEPCLGLHLTHSCPPVLRVCPPDPDSSRTLRSSGICVARRSLWKGGEGTGKTLGLEQLCCTSSLGFL